MPTLERGGSLLLARREVLAAGGVATLLSLSARAHAARPYEDDHP